MKSKLKMSRFRCSKQVLESRLILFLLLACFMCMQTDILYAYTKEDNKGLNYNVDENLKTISPEGNMQAAKTIKGRVVDAEGEPVIGAMVRVKGNDTKGGVTDVDGNFSIRDVKSSDVLVITFMGYKTVEQPVGDQTSFVITLEDDVVAMEEVVIVGFGKQKKESVVGAISTVKPEALQTPTRSLTQTLAGNLAGVISMQSSGEPGKDDAQFWIRGVSTFTGNQNPLVLVDGIERPLSNVDPLEIESFSVLKDASATAVYGVRGANGVILITTRRGFEGRPKIDVRIEQGFTSPSKRLKFVDAATRAELYNEALTNSNGSEANRYSAEEIEAYRSQIDPEVYPDVDWQDLLMKDMSYSQKLSVNFSGGGKFARFFTAVSYYKQEGQYAINPGPYDWVSPKIGMFGDNIDYQRYNFRTNVDMDITSSTLVSIGIQGNIVDNTEPNEGSAAIYRDIINTPPNASPVIFKDGKLAGRIGLNNPYNLLTQRGYKNTTGNDIRANIAVNQNFDFITQGLSATLRYAYDAENYNDAVRSRTINYFTASGRDEYGELVLKEEDASNYMDYMNYGSNAWGNKSHYLEASLAYDRTFNEKHEVGGLLLYYMKEFRNNKAANYISSLPNKNLGFAARGTYAFDKKYLAEVNFGFNGSENFPRGKRMGFFPAGALGWVVSQEEFMKDVDFIDWLKLRLSIGQVGNDNIGSERFVYLGVIDGMNGIGSAAGWGQNYDQQKGGVGESRLASPDVQWEVATKYNLGLEVNFFNDLRLTTDIFYERRNNIFIQPQTSFVTGFPDAIYTNDGKMENKGFEVSLEYVKQFNKDLMVSVRGNYTFARNTILDNGKYYAYPWQDVRGTRYGAAYGYKAMHLFTQEELDNLPDYYTQFNIKKSNLKPGDIRYEDLNDDGKINEADQTYIGHPTNAPEIVYGFGSTISYKDFDLSFLFQGAANRTASIGAAWYFQPFQADRDPKHMGNVMELFLDRWNDDNQNPNAFSPRLTVGANANNYKSSTWWRRDASYLRLKTLEFGYTLPAELSKKWYMQKARVYVSAFNLFTISDFYKKFWDPETGADAYPLQRQVFLGVNVSF